MSTHQPGQTSLYEDSYAAARSALGNSLTRAVPSPDGMYIAAIASPSQIHISRCPAGKRSMLSHVALIHSRQVQKVLAHADMLRWSPEVYSTSESSVGETASDIEGHLLRAWLMVSDRQRLIVLCIDLQLDVTSEPACKILADYDLGSQLGNFSFGDFIFSHEHAVLLHNLGIQVSIISLTRPERHDIANIKYPDNRGLAVRPDGKCFSLLTKGEGQDLVVIITMTEMGSLRCSSFSPLTYDAQGIKWCPDSDPLLCVWDSAAFGLKVLFFTANGHHLRQLDLDLEGLRLPSLPTNLEGLGVNTVKWLPCDGRAVLAVFDGSGRLFIQRQSDSERLHISVATIDHRNIIDGTKYQVWQESQDGDHAFSLHCASFEAHSVKRAAGADQMAINASCDLIATNDSSRPWILWICDIVSSQPLAVVNFRDRIKQLLWHPTAPEILVILTIQKEPLFYVWHVTKQQLLISKDLTTIGDVGMSDCEAKWLGGHLHESPLLFLSWHRQYEAGIIEIDQDGVIFQSVLSKGTWDGS